MSLRAAEAHRPRSRNGFVLLAVALFVLSVLMQYLGAMSPQRALAAGDCDSFAIFTTDAAGNTNNQNHYDSKPEVYLNGGPTSAGSLTAGTTLYYQVQEPDGTPLMAIRRPRVTPPISRRPVHTAVTVPVSSETDTASAGCPDVGRAVIRTTLPATQTR
jgi:hypothetical protein